MDLASDDPRYEAASDGGDSNGSSELQHSSLASVPEGDDADVSKVLKGNKRASWEQQCLPRPLQIYDVDTITLPCVDGQCHLTVKVGATQVGSWDSNLRTSPSFIYRTSRAPDMV